jgi:hypothetical protein
MEPRYVYSLNNSDWIGEFNSRKDARAAAIRQAHQQAETPGVVYVGKIVPANPQICRHGQQIIREMSDRAERAGLNNYLTALTAEQLRDLDQALARTLGDWLDRHHLRPTQFNVQAVSEYPVPNAAEVTQSIEKEISDLGPARQIL